jgi:hypothetical protein
VKPPKFEEPMSLTVFHQQFEAGASCSESTFQEKATHLLTILQGEASDILRRVPTGAAHEDTVGFLKGCYRDHQLPAAFWSQLKARIQLNNE